MTVKIRYLSAAEIARLDAIQMARELLIDDEPREIESDYYCEECQMEWTSIWDSACDDECAGCGREYSPIDWKYVDEEDDAD